MGHIAKKVVAAKVSQIAVQCNYGRRRVDTVLKFPGNAL
jgi:hypothetical protein